MAARLAASCRAFNRPPLLGHLRGASSASSAPTPSSASSAV